MKKFDLNQGIRTALYASLYAVFTIIFAPISYYSIQLRLSTALTILAFLDPAGIWGLTFGLILAGLYGGLGIFDYLVIPILSIPLYYIIWHFCKKYWQMVAVKAVWDALIIGPIVFTILALPWYLGSFWLTLGNAIIIIFLGYPLYRAVRDIYRRRGISNK